MTTDTIANFPRPTPPEEILDDLVNRATVICGPQAGDLDETTMETVKDVFRRIAHKRPRWPELQDYSVRTELRKVIVSECQAHGLAVDQDWADRLSAKPPIILKEPPIHPSPKQEISS